MTTEKAATSTYLMTVRVPRALRRKLRIRAAELDLPLQRVVVTLLERGLREEKP